MKKILVSLLVLALCAPAMAATTVSVTDNEDGTGVIVITTDAGAIVGLGLDIAVSGAQITAVGTMDPATFNIFPDAAQAEEAGDGYTYGEGSPVAVIGSAGVGTLPSDSFAISVGMLNGETTAGADGAATVSIPVTTDLTAGNSCTVTVTENALRGGIVLTTGAGVDIDSQTTDTISYAGALTCYDVLTAAEQTVYDAYIAAGKTDADMECWCYQYQCRGDVANDIYYPGILDYVVYQTDLTEMAANWRATPTTANPCADVKHDTYYPGILNYSVYQTDLNEMAANWRATTSTLTDCPGYTALNP
jgi:hypothetical protein